MMTINTENPVRSRWWPPSVQVAQDLLDRGADLPWENLTPLDAAAREHADQLVQWLRDRGAKSAS